MLSLGMSQTGVTTYYEHPCDIPPTGQNCVWGSLYLVMQLSGLEAGREMRQEGVRCTESRGSDALPMHFQYTLKR
jgi:hypothetical protein